MPSQRHVKERQVKDMFDVLRTVLDTPEKAYFLIVVFCFFMYKLGFQERKLPLLKAAVVYAAMAVGCIPLTTLWMLGMPIVEVLVLGTVILLVVRFSRRRTGKENGA